MIKKANGTLTKIKIRHREYQKEYYRRPEINLKRKQYLREYSANVKHKVLSNYSRGRLECACCGDNRYCFLSLDHIKPIKGNKKLRNMNLSALITKNFPIGLQVLCMNCNKLKNTKPECPCKERTPKRKQPTWNNKDETIITENAYI